MSETIMLSRTIKCWACDSPLPLSFTALELGNSRRTARRLFLPNTFLPFLRNHLAATPPKPQSHITNCITFTMGSIEEKAPAKCPMRLANVGGGGQKVGLHRHNIYLYPGTVCW
jgi:hypothetical protein